MYCGQNHGIKILNVWWKKHETTILLWLSLMDSDHTNKSCGPHLYNIESLFHKVKEIIFFLLLSTSSYIKLWFGLHRLATLVEPLLVQAWSCISQYNLNHYCEIINQQSSQCNNRRSRNITMMIHAHYNWISNIHVGKIVTILRRDNSVVF